MKEATTLLAMRGLTPVGDGREDFRRIYDRHYDEILAYFLRRSGQGNAQDLTAEVFLVAWRRLDAVPRGDETILWLYGVAGNVAAHQRRSVARGARLDTRLRAVPPPERHDEPELQVVRRAEYEQVLAAAERLRPADQEILRLAAWEELPHDHIARLLGVSVSAVDQRLHRAKKRLAKEYRKHSTQTEEGGRP
jgi:RNA polymerase sigma-70 factor (ECF subfamily)